GPLEIYVRSSSSGSAQWQISSGGGLQPQWTREGRELVYVRPDGMTMAVDVRETSGAIEAGVPSELFASPLTLTASGNPSPRNDYAVTRGGDRFLVISPVQNQADDTHVVLNW